MLADFGAGGKIDHERFGEREEPCLSFLFHLFDRTLCNIEVRQIAERRIGVIGKSKPLIDSPFGAVFDFDACIAFLCGGDKFRIRLCYDRSRDAGNVSAVFIELIETEIKHGFFRSVRLCRCFENISPGGVDIELFYRHHIGRAGYFEYAVRHGDVLLRLAVPVCERVECCCLGGKRAGCEYCKCSQHSFDCHCAHCSSPFMIVLVDKTGFL